VPFERERGKGVHADNDSSTIRSRRDSLALIKILCPHLGSRMQAQAPRESALRFAPVPIWPFAALGSVLAFTLQQRLVRCFVSRALVKYQYPGKRRFIFAAHSCLRSFWGKQITRQLSKNLFDVYDHGFLHKYVSIGKNTNLKTEIVALKARNLNLKYVSCFKSHLI
jgi:hypothetical protein